MPQAILDEAERAAKRRALGIDEAVAAARRNVSGIVMHESGHVIRASSIRDMRMRMTGDGTYDFD